MATKIKLGERPKTFKHTVTFPMLEGEDGCIEVEYAYRTREEFGEFIDSVFTAAKEKKPADEESISWAAVMKKTSGKNADYIMQAIRGWNLDEPFTKKNVQQLANELPAAVTAIMDAYRHAITEGRLGN